MTQNRQTRQSACGIHNELPYTQSVRFAKYIIFKQSQPVFYLYYYTNLQWSRLLTLRATSTATIDPN